MSFHPSLLSAKLGLGGSKTQSGLELRSDPEKEQRCQGPSSITDTHFWNFSFFMGWLSLSCGSAESILSGRSSSRSWTFLTMFTPKDSLQIRKLSSKKWRNNGNKIIGNIKRKLTQRAWLWLLSIDSGHFEQRNEKKHRFRHLRMGPTPLKFKSFKLWYVCIILKLLKITT